MSHQLRYTNKFTKTYILDENNKLIEKDTIHFYECLNCKTAYPIIDGRISYNGISLEMNIRECPYCEGKK